MFVHAGNRAIVTTHSPYILGEFNNLLYANEIQGVDEQRNAIVDEEKILPYDNSRAFYVADGFVKDAMEDHLIITSLIDGASDEINTENGRLIELKWSTPIIVSQDRRSDCQHRAQNVVKQNNLRSVVRHYKKEVPVESSTSSFESYLKSSRRASTACLCMSGRTWL